MLAKPRCSTCFKAIDSHRLTAQCTLTRQKLLLEISGSTHTTWAVTFKREKHGANIAARSMALFSWLTPRTTADSLNQKKNWTHSYRCPNFKMFPLSFLETRLIKIQLWRRRNYAKLWGFTSTAHTAKTLKWRILERARSKSSCALWWSVLGTQTASNGFQPSSSDSLNLCI